MEALRLNTSNRATLRCTILLMLLICLYVSIGCGKIPSETQDPLSVQIPSQSEWIDYGTIFERGDLGEWDYQLFGGFALSAVKQDGVIFLYYQGTSAYRLDRDETVLWRAIGVASSPDGVNFEKYPGNPVLTWFPTDEGEEGAVSSAALVAPDGEIAIFYGANSAIDATRVEADGRFATSTDGFNFQDGGIALDHHNSKLWGFGDEIFPVAALHNQGRWFVYYIPNGVLQSRRLGVAYGDGPDSLTQSSGVRQRLLPLPAWGTAGYGQVNPNTIVLFINNLREDKIEARLISLDAPHQAGEPVETYAFADVRQATFLLDEETMTWFMYYQSGDRYGLKIAPAGAPDDSPPQALPAVTAEAVSHRQIILTWDPATDQETGIVLYKVYRDGEFLGEIKGWHFINEGLNEQTVYQYQVSAVNYHGFEGPKSPATAVTTLEDNSPPSILGVNSSGDARQVILFFDEALEQTSAETSDHYIILPDILVESAHLSEDGRTVTLTTSAHQEGGIYSLQVSGVLDRAANPNVLNQVLERNYLHTSIPGLVASWKFDEGSGETAADTANYENHGLLMYTDLPGPVWVGGFSGSGLSFDGIDDQVTINPNSFLFRVTDSSYAISAWVKSDDIPSSESLNRERYTIIARDYNGLYYENTTMFSARLRLQSGTELMLSSGVQAPGAWHFVVMVVDDERKQLRLYMDGSEVDGSPLSYTGALADLSRHPFYIGASEPLRQRYEYRFRGVIDEMRIYNRPLTTEEISSQYQQASQEKQ